MRFGCWGCGDLKKRVNGTQMTRMLKYHGLKLILSQISVNRDIDL